MRDVFCGSRASFWAIAVIRGTVAVATCRTVVCCLVANQRWVHRLAVNISGYRVVDAIDLVDVGGRQIACDDCLEGSSDVGVEGDDGLGAVAGVSVVR